VSEGTQRCRACAAEVQGGALRCERCGAPQGALVACPHCRGEGGTSPHAELRFVCDLCGGPRIPRLDASIPPNGREVPLLRKADAARKARAAWRGAALGSGLALVLTAVPFVLLLFIVGAAPLLIVPGLLFTALFAGLLAMAVTRARARGREIGPLIDGAWVAAATDIARHSRGPLTALDLSQKLGIDESQADELLALLDVHQALDGGPIAGPPLRIEAQTEPAPAALQPAAAVTQLAEEEAALGDEAAAQRKKL
jgi:hypothetical protein